MNCTDAFTITKGQQLRCRDWLRGRPSAEELRETEERTGAHFQNITRAEMLMTVLTLKADQDSETLAFLPIFQEFLTWLQTVDEPEPEGEDDRFVNLICDILDALKEELDELQEENELLKEKLKEFETHDGRL